MDKNNVPKKSWKTAEEEWRTCICPMCEKKYEKRVFYTGPAKFPPFRCDECKSREEPLLSGVSEYEHNIPEDILTGESKPPMIKKYKGFINK